MGVMEKIVTWYGVLVKLHCKEKSTWVVLLCCIISMIVIGQIRLPNEQNLEVGVCYQDSVYGAKIVKAYEAGEHLFTLQEYTDWETVVEKVRAGKLCAGIRMDQELDSMIEEDRWDRSILFVTTPQSTKSAVLQESIFEAFLQVYSERLLEQNAEEIFARHAGPAAEKMKQYASEEGLFDVQQEYLDGKQAIQRESRLYPFSGMSGICMLLIFYLTAATGRLPCESVLNRTERIWFGYLNQMAAGLPFFLLFLSGGIQKNFWIYGIRLVLFSLAGGWWTMVLARVFHRESAVAFMLLFLIVGHLLVYPVAGDFAQLVPGVRIFRYLSPMWILTGI